ncbi:hypothetical protein AWB67_07457 [Caballeronia terrestris]|jgi:hypothetical protein|uniref:DUF3564 domain-containing protein n=3 Tax=Caballeronia TaxID=1827195 RepID=A0A158KSG2_9BURK|nr:MULTISPECIES: DUF3564 family protein [Caballeronia]SAL61749.1 hypothetical protein AWB65_05643 [Caballeronia humi]SAL84116.1 hypothetical protein AWB68_07172 [Caballeronia choica]SAL87682.1 hypothetical protein AWB67_07457 [Caballeronia terrestris]
MRITLHLDTFDRVCPCGYAILEIEKGAHRWLCKSQCGLMLPREGPLVKAQTGTLMCGPTDQVLLCVLEDFDASSHDGPFEGETGRALWYADQGIQPAAGHWHVELVTDCDDSPAHSASQSERV